MAHRRTQPGASSVAGLHSYMSLHPFSEPMEGILVLVGMVQQTHLEEVAVEVADTYELLPPDQQKLTGVTADWGGTVHAHGPSYHTHPLEHDEAVGIVCWGLNDK